MVTSQYKSVQVKSLQVITSQLSTMRRSEQDGQHQQKVEKPDIIFPRPKNYLKLLSFHHVAAVEHATSCNILLALDKLLPSTGFEAAGLLQWLHHELQPGKDTIYSTWFHLVAGNRIE